MTCPSSDEPGAERHDRRTNARGGANDRADFIGRERIHDDVGDAGGMPRLAVAVVLELRRVGRAAVAEERLEFG